MTQATAKDPRGPFGAVSTDEEIVRRVAEGDQAAIAELYDRYRQVVFGLALRVLRDRGEAEEVHLDTFLQVWRTASRYDPGRGSVSAWLMTLTRSRAIDRLRARPRPAMATEDLGAAAADAGAPGPEEAMEQVLRQRRVTRALSALSEPQQRAIALAYYRGLSHAEIAATLGVPLGTIKTRIRGGLRALRDSLAAHFASEEETS